MRKLVGLTVALLGACLHVHTGSAQPSDLQDRIERYVAANQKAIVGELVQLLSIPNVAADEDDIRRNATLLRTMLERRGFAAELLETDGNPLVYGEMRVPGATRTLLLYAHYDGQPVNPPGWKQPTPFTPILRDGRLEDGGREIPNLDTRSAFEPDWRLYARSASDDKSPIVALCAALDGLKASNLAPTSNVRVILDGEEEAGSPSLVPAIARYRDKLGADVMLILDGPVHPSGRPTLVFGARGIVTLDLTVYGPKVALHSGHYGNWAPNPAMRLAQLLATFKDDNGRVLVEGFYDGIPPLTAEQHAMLDVVPDDEKARMRLFGIAAPEDPQRSLQEGLQIPTFNVRGFSSGFVGAGARTIVPDSATAS
ncbi:MAG: M20/M25/M40 family metallo-hydrolase, partial [Vicinamibacteraceae bacterium]